MCTLKFLGRPGSNNLLRTFYNNYLWLPWIRILSQVATVTCTWLYAVFHSDCQWIFLLNRYCRVNDRILELEKQHEEVSDVNISVYNPLLVFCYKILWINSLMPCYMYKLYVTVVSCTVKQMFQLSLSFTFQRVNVIRRSYRQQLADAITQIANQHQVQT